MVRLRVSVLNSQLLNSSWFQFQDGAIKSLQNQVGSDGLLLFQFQDGAIKSLSADAIGATSYQVSIPRWCD